MQEMKNKALMNDDIQIKINHVGMTFKDNQGNDVQALKDVNLDIKKGEFISLLGPSGCGKTTLLRIIADLQEPTTGTVRINGMTPREVRLQQKFGIVFQSPVLLDWRTVRKNIELPLEIMDCDPKKLPARSQEMLDLVGLSKFADHYPKQLSGGMQQRVGIARALGMEPELLLMDEPFSALDEFTKEKLHMDLLDIWSKTNKTIIFVTHNIQEAVLLSDRICVLSPHPGRLSAVIDVDIDRPRRLEDRDTMHFAELVSKVRNSFEGGSL
ncbi:MAG: ABC transporter ATP-binding protein [Eubacterium ramulus]|uniref:ABC transporter ATP-binding protein n=1 Tax=Eubacterium ramulus TaxID=39490 RepID=UPI0039A2B84F